jgi:CRISPR/Cas system-associated exonuclease Cas4 (RecB family)
MRNPEPISITHDDELYEQIMSRMKEKLGVGKPREGTHVSDLLYCSLKSWAKKQLGLLPDAAGLLGEDDDQVLVWVVGRSHEDMFGGDFIHGMPEEKDGIIGTIDFAGERLIEAKSTRYSSKKWLDEMPHYIAQAASYAYMHDQTEVNVLVFHIQGDYYHQTKEGKAKKAGPKAHLRIYKVRFEKKELKKWWRELQRRKGIYEGAEKPKVEEYPELIPVYEWECGFCKVGGLVGCPMWKE